MSVAAVTAQVRSVLTSDVREGSSATGVHEAINEIEILAPRERLELVLSTTWGDLVLARLVRDPSNETFRLLRVLSDARPSPLQREQFYASFDCQGLCEICGEQLRASSTIEDKAITIRLCIRNLARNPVFRLRLSGSVSHLAASLNSDEIQSHVNLQIAAASAAALCNICCDNAFKAEAVRLGVVPSLLQSLKRAPMHSAAEDLVACLGVLTASYPPGMEALFQSNDAAVILACLCESSHPMLQVLAAEVVSDLCSCSKSFTAWLVHDTDLVQAHLGQLLDLDVDPQLLNASLKLCTRLAEDDGFGKKAQQGAAVKALQNIATLPQDPVDGAWEAERRPPTKQEEARALLGKILYF
eukprot:TRINITY_DN67392_c0_g1_i1.p1 TRINITY_DN67392_c0_g1~~TRINITY_DN67392_c0_g1_i1.p1  ORF type:complete len:357 (-),score=42.82 TRINITY_DN67392_c0_g1_i1:38-1108(-)